jgi:Xaa-Pro dipeptidase
MMLGPRERALWDAQRKAEMLFGAVVSRGGIRPGVLESELSREVHALARELFAVKRHWHRRIVRSGPNTLCGYHEDPPDRRLEPDDILFFDFGPVFADWEADLGRSYVLGADPDKHRLVADLGHAFARGQALYESTPGLTAGELYDYVAGLAGEYSWAFGAPSAGHPVDSFPHEGDPSQQHSIKSGNALRLREPLADGTPRHWILEIHFVDRARAFGGFYEELLTIRGSRTNLPP